MTSPDSIRWQEVRAVSLDAAGTLIEPHPSVGHVYAEVAADSGLGRWEPALLEARFRSAWGVRGDFDFSRTAWIRLVDHVWSGLVSGPVPEAFFEVLWSRFTEARVWRVYSDVLPCLSRLRSQGWPIAVVSNWDERLHAVFANLGLTQQVDFLLPSVEAPAPKPDPRIFGIAARRLGVEPGRLLHVGDGESEDFRGIREAGGQGILLRRRGTPCPPLVLESLADLPHFLGNH
ncbi:MAG: HAD-IA family hydrolase [Verrucomicrobia bacterium]|nr:HAD-IA family hydrolase [Verrucomicrobiota bacterium]